jgi:hypothetical protein
MLARRLLPLAVALALAAPASATVPLLVGHQGRITVQGRPFEGAGLFKFAIVDADGSTTHWSHDGSSVAGGEPVSAISLPVVRGLYSLALGDTALANMGSLSAAIIDHPDVHLRVWFNDGTRGFQQIVPDQRLTAVPYALRAAELAGQISAANIADGAIPMEKLSGVLSASQLPLIATAGIADDAVTSAKILDGAIVTADLADNSITSAKILDGAVGTAELADGAVTSVKLAEGAITSAALADAIITLSKLAADSIDGSKIVDGSVAEADLADNSITGAKIVDGAVGTAELADGAVTSLKLAEGAITSAALDETIVT